MPTRKTTALPETKRANIYDVAAAAGVTISTVSRSFSETDRISAETRRKVLAAARELNYRPNALAGALTTKKTLLLGLFVSDIRNPFVADMVRGAQDAALPRRYFPIVCSTEGQAELELSLMEDLLARGVDGLIMTPFFGIADPDAQAALAGLPDRGVPLVMIGHLDGLERVDWIVTEAEAGAREAVGHLVGLGHRRIACLAGYRSKGIAVGRWRAYKQALEEAGLTVDDSLTVEAATTLEGGREAMKTVLSAGSPPTAVFAVNDLMAIGAIEACREAGLDVPRDVSIVGFDDIPRAASIVPPLTTVAQPSYELGRQATEMLLDRIADPERTRQHRVLECTFRPRASTAPPRSDDAAART